MPSQQRNFVWGVDSIGHVHTLATINQHWDRRSHRTDGRLLEIKQVSATKYSVWGIGCDQELYAYVHSGDVPIRCLEYTYENQASGIATDKKNGKLIKASTKLVSVFRFQENLRIYCIS